MPLAKVSKIWVPLPSNHSLLVSCAQPLLVDSFRTGSVCVVPENIHLFPSQGASSLHLALQSVVKPEFPLVLLMWECKTGCRAEGYREVQASSASRKPVAEYIAHTGPISIAKARLLYGLWAE